MISIGNISHHNTGTFRVSHSQTVSHTTQNKPSRMLLALWGGSAVPTTVTYNGVVLTQVLTRSAAGAAVAIWRYFDPPVGTFNLAYQGTSIMGGMTVVELWGVRPVISNWNSNAGYIVADFSLPNVNGNSQVFVVQSSYHSDDNASPQTNLSPIDASLSSGLVTDVNNPEDFARYLTARKKYHGTINFSVRGNSSPSPGDSVSVAAVEILMKKNARFFSM